MILMIEMMQMLRGISNLVQAQTLIYKDLGGLKVCVSWCEPELGIASALLSANRQAILALSCLEDPRLAGTPFRSLLPLSRVRASATFSAMMWMDC
jgi:hypothetical protein